MKIICVGRNYVDHIKELSNDKPTDPVIFIKPDTALLEDSKFYYPSFSNDVHYELELVFKIGKVGKNIEAKFAHKYIDSYGLGIDFTARDLQSKLKEKVCLGKNLRHLMVLPLLVKCCHSILPSWTMILIFI